MSKQEIVPLQYNCPFNEYDICHFLRNRPICPHIYRIGGIYFGPLNECEIIGRCLRAFQNNEYGVLQHFYTRVVKMDAWELFVWDQTKKSWASSWRLKVGRYLMKLCEKDDSCPFKALLLTPEIKH